MSRTKLRGVRIWNLVPCDSGFGEWESTGATFVKKDSIKPNPKLDGLIRNQTGKAVTAETADGVPVNGMLVNKYAQALGRLGAGVKKRLSVEEIERKRERLAVQRLKRWPKSEKEDV